MSVRSEPTLAVDVLRPGPRWPRRVARNRGAVVGIVILVALTVIAIVGPSLVRDPTAQNIPVRLEPPNSTLLVRHR